jgi:hypothetical protein
MKQQTAVEWYFDKIKSHFEHDGDLFEVACMTYAIAKQKEKDQLIYAVTKENKRCTQIANDAVSIITQDKEKLFRPDETIGEITYKQMFEI